MKCTPRATTQRQQRRVAERAATRHDQNQSSPAQRRNPGAHRRCAAHAQCTSRLLSWRCSRPEARGRAGPCFLNPMCRQASGPRETTRAATAQIGLPSFAICFIEKTSLSRARCCILCGLRNGTKYANRYRTYSRVISYRLSAVKVRMGGHRYRVLNYSLFKNDRCTEINNTKTDRSFASSQISS